MRRLSRGAYLSFDTAALDRLKELLGAVAVYAAGGYRALTAYGEKKGRRDPASDRATARVRPPPVLYLLGGFAVLGGVLLLAYLFVNADPARLARGLKVTGIIIAVVAVATLAISGRLAAAAHAAGDADAVAHSGAQRARPPPPTRRGSKLDRRDPLPAHDTRPRYGNNGGDDPARPLRRHATGGARPGDLLALLRECRAEDEEGARLLEAYLDRPHPGWRDDLAGEPRGTAGGGRGAGPASGDMTVDEAYAILGLAPGADADAIKEAHRRLMVKLHPDHGGSDYLATKINRARDVLLHR